MGSRQAKSKKHIDIVELNGSQPLLRLFCTTAGWAEWSRLRSALISFQVRVEYDFSFLAISKKLSLAAVAPSPEVPQS